MCWAGGQRPRPVPLPGTGSCHSTRFACPSPGGCKGSWGFSCLPVCQVGMTLETEAVLSRLPALSLFLFKDCWRTLTKSPGRSEGPAWLLEMGVHKVLSANDCTGCWGLSLMKCLSDCSDRAGTEGSGGGSCSELAAGSQHSGTGACGCPSALLPDLLLSLSARSFQH